MKKELFDLITALFLAKGKQMPTGTLDVWASRFEKYPIEKLRGAFDIEMDSLNEWPVIGHVLAHLDSTESDALAQFSLIERSNAWHPDLGWTGPKSWNDIADRSLREIGGIGSVQDATERSLPFLRKEFVSAYERNKNIKRVEFPSLEASAKKLLEGM